MDSGASSHMASDPGNLSYLKPSTSQSVTVGNGSSIPITHTGYKTIHSPSKPLHLHNILVVPNIIKNLISVRQFTIDNYCSIQFDPYGFSVKDLLTGTVILRCNSIGPLYSMCQDLHHAAFVPQQHLDRWHRRLGHPGHTTMSRLAPPHTCHNKTWLSLCHACQLGKNVRKHFHPSSSRTFRPFERLHCDLWTSPVPNTSGFCYYLIIVDDFTQYFWSFPLRKKSEVYATFVAFHALVKTQFQLSILSLQCGNGKEFDNSNLTTFCTMNGILHRFSCPYTSQQNGKAERAICTTNDVIRTLLFQASMPPTL